jgi:hypothetical protein
VFIHEGRERADDAKDQRWVFHSYPRLAKIEAGRDGTECQGSDVYQDCRRPATRLGYYLRLVKPPFFLAVVQVPPGTIANAS